MGALPLLSKHVRILKFIFKQFLTADVKPKINKKTKRGDFFKFRAKRNKIVATL